VRVDSNGPLWNRTAGGTGCRRRTKRTLAEGQTMNKQTRAIHRAATAAALVLAATSPLSLPTAAGAATQCLGQVATLVAPAATTLSPAPPGVTSRRVE
jgi:hypothetical protein